MPPSIRVAALASVHHHWSHADVILDKSFNGYPPDRKEFPSFKVASMYVDQFPKDDRRPDLSRDLGKQHGFKVYDTVRDALTHGGKTLAVDGVLSIFEHGDYPKNRYTQTLYPRRKMFEEITKVFEATGKTVPVFSDKHLAVKWDDALWMVETSRKMMFPFMAGSSVPVTYREPDLVLPMGCELEAAVSIGYGHLEHYGFHALEGLQSMIERRKFNAKPGEAPQQGVKTVTAHYGKAIWEKVDANPLVKDAFEAALSRIIQHSKGDVRDVARPDSTLMEIEYRDGFRAFVVMLNGWLGEGDGGAFTFGARLKGQKEPLSTLFYLDQRTDMTPHFMLFVKAIDAMFRTGHAVIPVERTLLTSGILEMVLRSRFTFGERIETPHLDVKYRAGEWPHGGPVPPWLEATKKFKK